MSITQLLGIKYPILQGAMSHISTHSLVSAVSNAGGLGILASASWSAERLQEEIKKTKELTDKPFGVNLMLQMDNIPELVDVIIQEKVKVVTTGAGNPGPYLHKLKEAGIIVLPVIAAVRHAQKMEELGVDGVIAEGQEAGGHIGFTSTMSLIPQIIDAVDIPVIAAGGIGDGRSIAAAFALGAKGVQAGTVFLATDECPIPQKYKEMILEANDLGTLVTGRTAKDPVRSLKNKMILDYAELELNQAPKEELENLTKGSLYKAAVEGDLENGSAMAGEISGLITEIRPVADVIDAMMKQAKDVANNLTIK